LKTDLFLKETKGAPIELAAKVGQLYRKAKSNFIDSMKLVIECGEKLKTQRERLLPGEWISWLEKNRDVLGFSRVTAWRLIKAANFSTRHLTESKALALSRQIWGHQEHVSQRNMEDEFASESKDLKKSSGLVPDGRSKVTDRVTLGAEEHGELPDPPPEPTKPLDANPRRCTASCCQPDGSDIVGPWNVHDAQALLDQRDFRYGFFKEYHKSILDFGVDCRLERAIEQFKGGLARGAYEIPERQHRYKGI